MLLFCELFSVVLSSFNVIGSANTRLLFDLDSRMQEWYPLVSSQIIIIYRFLERHILKALWRFTILKINNLTNQKTIKSLSKKKGLEAPFECI